MRIMRILITSKLQSLPNTANILNHLIRSITISNRGVIVTRPLLSIPLSGTLPSRRITNLRKISTPPLRNTIQSSQRAMRRRLHHNSNKTTQAEPIQLHVHNTNRLPNRQLNPHQISNNTMPHPRTTHLRRFHTRRPLQNKFNRNQNQRRYRVDTSHTLVIILHRLLDPLSNLNLHHTLRANRVKNLQLTRSLRTRRQRRTKRRQHIGTTIIPQTTRQVNHLLISQRLTCHRVKTKNQLQKTSLRLRFTTRLHRLVSRILPLTCTRPTRVLTLTSATRHVITQLTVNLRSAIPSIRHNRVITKQVHVPIISTINLVPNLIQTFAQVLGTRRHRSRRRNDRHIKHTKFHNLSRRTTRASVSKSTNRLPSSVHRHRLTTLTTSHLRLHRLIRTIKSHLRIQQISRPRVHRVLNHANSTRQRRIRRRNARQYTRSLQLNRPEAILMILAQVRTSNSTIHSATTPTKPLINTHLTSQLSKRPLRLNNLQVPTSTNHTQISRMTSTQRNR